MQYVNYQQTYNKELINLNVKNNENYILTTFIYNKQLNSFSNIIAFVIKKFNTKSLITNINALIN